MAPFETINLRQGFRAHFELLPALDEKTRNQVYTIRHEVYCEELGYEPAHPDRHEKDRYDSHSLHCLMRTADDTATLAGCCRLVMANPEDPAEALPFEEICLGHLEEGVLAPDRYPRRRIAEVSRLAIRYMFRRRRGEKHDPLPIHKRDFGEHITPRFPFIPVGLYLASVAMAERRGIEKLFVLTEPRLAEHFAKLGVDILRIGEPVQHRGLRIPSVMDVNGIIAGIRPFLRPMWELIREEIHAGFDRATRVPTDSMVMQALRPRQ